MSRLIETAAAYKTVANLLDQEIRKRSGSTADLQRQRDALDVAFYLLGWAQFEHLVKKEAEQVIDEQGGTRHIARHAWAFMNKELKRASVRQKLDLIFHGRDAVRASLDKDYTVRNEAAHNYRMLPPEAKDVGAFLQKLQKLVDEF